MDIDAKPLVAIVAAAIVGLVAIAGVAGGSAIGQAPIIKQAGTDAERRIADYDGGGVVGHAGNPKAATAIGQDRFAISTPEGRFEVAELRARGREGNHRYSDFDRVLAAERMAVDGSHAVPDPGFADRAWSDAGGMPPLPAAPRVAAPVHDGEAGPSSIGKVRVHSGEGDRRTVPAAAPAPVPIPEVPAVEPPAAPEPSVPPVVTARIY